MKQFGELLKEYIQTNNYTIYQIAKETGIDRSFLQGVLTGKRKLPQKRFADIVNSSYFIPSQISSLCNAYYLEKLGQEKMKSFEFIEHGLTGKIKEELSKEYKTEKIKLNSISSINGHKEVLSLIYTVLHLESSVNFASNFDFNNSEINRMVYNLCTKKQFKSFFHYVSTKEASSYDKLNIFFNSCHYAEIGYTTYLYKKGLFSEFLPYFILTDKYFIQYDNDCENAIILYADAVNAIMEDKLNKIKSECTSDVYICNDGFESMKTIYLLSASSKQQSLYVIENNVCSWFCDSDIISNIATNEIKSIPAIINQLESHYFLMLGNKNNAIKKFQVTYNGIEEFIQTGRIDAFPQKYAQNVPMHLREKVINNILKMFENSNSLNIINSQHFTTNYKFELQINNNKLIFGSCNDINEPDEFISKSIYSTDDKQMVEDLIDYIEYISVSEKSYDCETSKDILKAFVHKLEGMM